MTGSHTAGTSRKRCALHSPETSEGSSEHTPSAPETTTAPAPAHEDPIAAEDDDALIISGDVLSRDAPRRSDFVSDDAAEWYRASRTRVFLTERRWVLSEFGSEPLVVDRRPVLDWVDWKTTLTE